MSSICLITLKVFFSFFGAVVLDDAVDEAMLLKLNQRITSQQLQVTIQNLKRCADLFFFVSVVFCAAHVLSLRAHRSLNAKFLHNML